MAAAEIPASAPPKRHSANAPSDRRVEEASTPLNPDVVDNRGCGQLEGGIERHARAVVCHDPVQNRALGDAQVELPGRLLAECGAAPEQSIFDVAKARDGIANL